MKGWINYQYITIFTCVVAGIGTVHADDSVLNLALPVDSLYTRNNQFNVLALNDDSNPQTKLQPTKKMTDFKEPILTGNKVHQYLGLGTIALVGLTAVTAPDSGENKTKSTSGIHPTLGRAAATLAAATVTTGLLYHWKDIHLEDGLTDPDNMHAMLGVAGALAMLYAVSKAPDSGHSGTGIMGGIAMGLAVKLTW